ncbi:MAG: HAD-IC family P-type ATPase, partial [Bacillota bacterium]
MIENPHHDKVPTPAADSIPDAETGLTSDQVRVRIGQGLTNQSSESLSKSVRQIVSENVFTLFNLLNIVLALLIVMVGSYRNLLFILVIISNTIIGIIQELRAKRTIDKLSIVTAPLAHVLRDGQRQDIHSEQIVLDDIMLLLPGNQICADSVLVAGESLTVDESLLTGESDPVVKHPGDTLFSGSFVVSGNGRARVTTVGEGGYASSITKEARYFKKPNSQLVSSLNRIILAISYIIVPLGILLFLRQFFLGGQTLEEAVVSTVASLIGMIPEGLILLTSVALAVGVVRLGTRRTLVQQLPSIETLARVDVLCLDKTGTITKGAMQVEEVIPMGNTGEGEITAAFAALACALPDSNATFQAISAYFGQDTDWESTATVPFSSERKWSAAGFPGRGTYIMGAPDIIFPDNADLSAQTETYAKRGMRVLALAHSLEEICKETLPRPCTLKALLIISDVIREEA